MSYDARTIQATTPSGVINDQMRRPVDGVNVSARLEQVLGGGNTLRGEFSRRDNSQENLGVGDFDLDERAYQVDIDHRHAARAQHQGLRQEAVQRDARRVHACRRRTQSRCRTVQTIRVLDSFTSGGAGLDGVREGRQFTVAQNFDYNVKKHALRFGARGERRLVGQQRSSRTPTARSPSRASTTTTPIVHGTTRGASAIPTSATRNSTPAGTSRTTSA